MATLESVEMIMQWREGLNIPKPFIWKQQNYLIKIQDDLQFFQESPLSTVAISQNGQEMPPGMESDGVGGVQTPPLGSPVHDQSDLSLPPLMDKRESIDISFPSSSFGGNLEKLSRRIAVAEKVIENEPILLDSLHHQEDDVPTLKTARRRRSSLNPIVIKKKKSKTKTKKKKTKKKKSSKTTSVKPIRPETTEEVFMDDSMWDVDDEVANINDPNGFINEAATLIQAAWKGYKVRSEYQLLSETQRVIQNSALMIQCAYRKHRAEKTKQDLFVHQVRAKLQSQALTREMLTGPVDDYSIDDDMSFDENYGEAHEKSAFVIQDVWHSYVLRQHVQLAYQRQRFAIIRTQAGIRTCLVNIELSALHNERVNAAINIQRVYRGHQERLRNTDYKAARKQRNDSAIMVQRVFRGWKGRQKRDEWILQREMAALTIQPLVVQFLARCKLRDLKAEEERRFKRIEFFENAAFTLQTVVRGYLDAIKYQQLVQRHRAATKIQAVMKGHKVRQNIRRDQAARKIQKGIRMFHAKKRFDKRLLEVEHEIQSGIDQELAAQSMQRVYRGHVERKATREMRHEYKTAATTIQCMWRSKKAKQEAIQLRAIIRIQNLFRGFMARKYYSQSKAAQTIQLLWKRNQARKYVDSLKTQKEKELLTFEQREVAASGLQRAVRCFLAKKRTNRLRTLTNASITLQKFARMHNARGYVMWYSWFKPRNDAATKIQSMVRGYLDKNYVLLLRADQARKKRSEENHPLVQLKHHAATQIQRIVRGFLVREWCRRASVDAAATIIQRASRQWLAKCQLRRARAAVSIQRVARGWLARREVYSYKYRATKAATKIQCMARQWFARRYVKQYAASIQIQRIARGFLARQRVNKLRNTIRENAAATTIQCAYRQRLANKLVKRHKSAITIQAHMRGYLVRNLVRMQREAEERRIRALQDAAALSIQKIYRGFSSRQKVEAYKNQANKSALRIQTAARVWLANRYVQKYKAAKKVQHLAKLWLAGRRIERLKSEKSASIDRYIKRENAALTIQRYFRGFCGRLTTSDHLKTRRKNRSATRIQCMVRAYLARREMQRLNALFEQHVDSLKRQEKAAVKIQTLVRASQAREYVKQYRIQVYYWEASTTLQRFIRCSLAKKKALRLRTDSKAKLNNELQREKSAMAIQKIIRSSLAKSRVHRIKQDNYLRHRETNAASRIQALFQGWKDRAEAKELRRSVVFVQSHIRTQLLHAGCDHESNAARVIQYSFKTYKAKKEASIRRNAAFMMTLYAKRFLLRKHSAAKIIQRQYRSHASEKFKKMHIVIGVQSQIRSYLEQLHYNSLLMNIAALTLQKNFKAFKTRMKAQLQTNVASDEHKRSVNGYMVREYAASTIQCAYRQHMAKSKASQLRKEEWAAKVIQRAERKRQAEVKAASVTLVQSRIRQMLGFWDTERRLSMMVLDFADSLIGADQESIKQESVKRMQRAARALLARLTVNRRRKEYYKERHERVMMEWYTSHHHIDHVIFVQSQLHQQLGQKKFKMDKEHYSNEDTSVLKIQCAWRQHQARKVYNARHEVIQAQRNWQDKLNDASLTVQNRVRQYYAQTETFERKRVFLIDCVQRYIRAIASRKDCLQRQAIAYRHQHELIRESAAVVIQRAFKVSNAKQELNRRKDSKEKLEARTVENASRILQKQREIETKSTDDRMYAKRAMQKKHMTEIELEGARRIQCASRCYLAYKEISKRQHQAQADIRREIQEDKETNSAVILQTLSRRYLSGKALQRKFSQEDEYWRHFMTKESSAVFIQKTYRGYKTRKDIETGLLP